MTTFIGGAFVLLSGLFMVGWITWCYFHDKPMKTCLCWLVLYWLGVYGIVHFM